MNHDKKVLAIACFSPLLVTIVSYFIFKEIEITIVLAIVTSMLALIIYRLNHTTNISSNPIYKEHIKQIQKYLKKQNKKIFSQNLPISIIIGPTRAGKSGFLQENNIKNINNDNFPDIDLGTWWQNKNELFLEIETNNEFKPHSENNNFWQQIITAIQTRSFFCYNLKNIVITLPVTTIHNSNNNNFNKIIANIQELLKTTQEIAPNTKINVVFTQCDKILGFQSFFYDLSKDERNNLLATFKNTNNYNSSIAAICKKNLPLMIESMQQHVLKRLRQEHDPLRKFEIKDFPLQMEQLVEPTISLLKQLELIMPKKVFGVYYCCNNISNNLVDFIHNDSQPLSKSSQISILGTNDKIHGYFNSNIIEQINCLKIKVKYTKKDISIMGIMSAVCLTSIYFCQNIYLNYSATNGITSQVQNLISNNNNSSELDKLYLALEYMNKTGANNSTHELKEELEKHYDSYLEQAIEEDIANYLGNIIAEKVANKQTFYPELIKFKSMSGRKLTSSEQTFLINSLSHNSKHKILTNHMQNYVKKHEFNLILNPATKTIIQEQLGGLDLKDKALLLIANDYQLKNNSKLDIVNILTPEYLTNKMPQEIQAACNAISVGKDGNLEMCNAQTKEFYLKEYKNYWLKKANINISNQEKLTSRSQLLEYLEQFNSENEKLIKDISTAKTALLVAGITSEDNNNDWIEIFTNKEIVNILGDIQRMCHDNKEQEFYEEIFQQIKVPEKSIVARANKLADNLSGEQQAWLRQLTNSFDDIASNEAYNYLNNIWQHTVIAYYQKKIANKFPLNQDSKDNMNFVDFEQFFGPNGILNTYLKLIGPIHSNKKVYSSLDEKNINAFHSISKIIINWFDKYNKPRLYMTLIPMDLEHNAKKFILEIGNKKIELSKEKEKTSEIIWPEYGDNLVTLEFENTLGQSSIKNKNNPWSFLQLLNETDIEENINKKEFIITFKLDAFRAKYQLLLQNAFDIKSYGGIKEFKLSEKL